MQSQIEQQTPDVTVDKSDRILRLSDVIIKSGLSRSSIYSMVDAGHFPVPIQLGARRIGWLESEIVNWICQRILLRRP